MERQTSLSKNIVQFCRYLRQENFNVSTEEEAVALEALQFIDLSNQYIFQLTLKSVLCKDHNVLERFDDLSRQYWHHLHRAVNAKSKDKEKKNRVMGAMMQMKKIDIAELERAAEGELVK